MGRCNSSTCKMSIKLVLLFGLMIAPWTLDAAAIQNTANLVTEQTVNENTVEVKFTDISEETAGETVEELTTEEKTEENTEELTTEEEKTEELTTVEEKTEKTVEKSSVSTENDHIPSLELKEEPVKFKHFVDVASIHSEIPPPPFGVNPDFNFNEGLPQQLPLQQGSAMKFVFDPTMVDVQQGMYVQQQFFQGIDGTLRPVIRQVRQGSNYFSPRGQDQLKKPFHEDPIGDDEPSLHLMSTMRPEYQQIPVPVQVPQLQRVPFIYPQNLPVSKPMMHLNTIESNEIFHNPQMHMMMPVTLDTPTGPMVFYMPVPSNSFAMQGF